MYPEAHSNCDFDVTTVLSREQINKKFENDKAQNTLRQAIERGDMNALMDKDGHPAWLLWRGATAGTSLLQLATSFPVNPDVFVPLATRQGISMTEMDGKGRSIMFYAFNAPADKRMAWLKALHKAGLPMSHPDESGQTALSMAVLKGDNAILDWLIELGIAPTEEDRRKVNTGNHRSAIQRFWDAFGQEMNVAELSENLIKACQDGRWQYASLLLDHGADPLVQTSEGCTTLMLALSRTRAPCALAERLVKMGVDPTITINRNGKIVTAMNLLEENNRQGNSRSQKRVEEARLAIARGRELRLTNQLETLPLTLRPTRNRM